MSKWKTASLLALGMFGALQANAACRGDWVEGPTFAVGDTVIYKTIAYTAQVTHTAHVGANWNPLAAPTLWKVGGSCSNTMPSPTATAKPTITPTIAPTPSPSAKPTAIPTVAPTPSPTPTTKPTTAPSIAPTATPTSSPTPTVTPTIAPTAAPSSTPVPLPSGAPTQVVLNNRFDQHVTGLYQAAQFKADWGIEPGESTGVPSGRLSIVADTANPANKVLRVTYLAGKVGGNSAMTFDAPLASP
ncbi:MAG: carbohydrate-binding protein, partial [Deefgea sp.]